MTSFVDASFSPPVAPQQCIPEKATPVGPGVAGPAAQPPPLARGPKVVGGSDPSPEAPEPPTTPRGLCVFCRREVAMVRGGVASNHKTATGVLSFWCRGSGQFAFASHDYPIVTDRGYLIEVGDMTNPHKRLGYAVENAWGWAIRTSSGWRHVDTKREARERLGRVRAVHTPTS